MAGSKRGKHSKGKGKSQSNKSETINKKPEVFNSKLDLAQSSNNPDALDRSRCKYTEKELKDLFYKKFEWLYATAKDWLLKLGYRTAEVETAILSAGYIHGRMDILNNILMNSISFIEKRVEPPSNAFKDMGGLYHAMLESMVVSFQQTRPDLKRSDAMCHLLERSWCCAPSVTRASILESENSSHSKNEDAEALGQYSAKRIRSQLNADPSLKRVGIMERVNFTPELESYFRWNVLSVADEMRRKLGIPVIDSGTTTEISDTVSSDFLTEVSYEPNDARIANLLKDIGELQEKVKDRKSWAQKKTIDIARTLSEDLLELKLLRMDKMDLENKKRNAEKSQKLKMLEINESRSSLQNMNRELSFSSDDMGRLRIKNAQIRADTEALKLNRTESDMEVADILKRERKCVRKLSVVEKQNCNLQSQCQEEKQTMLQLELELLQVEKDTKEDEVSWRQNIKEKEYMLAIRGEEIRTAEIHKANSRAELTKLRQKREMESQLGRDDFQRLEDELSRLRVSQQMRESGDSSYEDAEATSSESSAPIDSSERSIRHWICMMCLENEVSVVFLPCAHQVLCFPCHERNLSTVGAQCPYCHVGIEESIKVFGPSS
ncbi:hypothetical protein ABFS82_02G134300 [Erythranthe guttata]|uniref:MND1-interacting protein 1-like n=1 Tax=Erythranthe guttata TaxID=4155 RepID=UPI00064DC8A2|nr:PREDICTED: MND1-interacting protein 1-like [Erythranthe guttata]|eukprot:XP_012833915.1 PREDICTED: MND1-interacting protein 1-like [Erythranthe guttata]